MSLALKTDLASHSEHWDYTNLHWFNDYAYNGLYFANYESPAYFYGGTATVHDAYTLLKSTGTPLFVDETGSSNGDSCTASTANDAAAAVNSTNLMTELLTHTATTATEPGVVAASYYQLYPEVSTACSTAPDIDKYLFTAPGAIAAQGTAVKAWIAANGGGANPSVNAAATFTLSNTAVTIAAPGGSGTSTISLTPGSAFAGTVNLSCFVWGEKLTDPTMAPVCSFAGASSATIARGQTVPMTVKSATGSAVQNYVVTVIGTQGGASVDTSSTVNLK